jgi:hypothetical protein
MNYPPGGRCLNYLHPPTSCAMIHKHIKIPQLLVSLCFYICRLVQKKTSMKILALAALIPMMAAPAMAGPYVESKTVAAGTLTDGGTYKGAQTEVRGGYQTKVGTSGLKVYAEVGPGYEWNNGGTNEGVVVSEVGLSYPLATNLSLKTKVAGEYGLDSESFDLGGEVKVRYSF